MITLHARSVVTVALLLASGGCDGLGMGELPAPKPPPHLAFTETTVDFGRVAQGTPVEHLFTFANDGGTALTIIDVRAACDCDATLLGGTEIEPGAGGAVRGRFDTHAVFGPQRRTVTVYSNDPLQRTVLLTLTGEVELDVAADPPQVYLGAVPPGAAVVREVALRVGSEGVQIGAPISAAPQLGLRLGPARDGTVAATLGIGTSETAPPGPFTAEVRVPTTSPRHPLVRIAVSGIIDPAAPTPRPIGGGPPATGAPAEAPPPA